MIGEEITMAFAQGHALLIGVGSHQFHRALDAPITVKDAEAVAMVLQDETLCGYTPEQVRLLHDDTAAKAGILSALDDLAQRAGSKDTVFLFYCGHGALGTDGNYYLVSHDARLRDGRVEAGTGVSEGELLEKLKAIQAQRMLLIFNACHSGNISPTLAPEPSVLQAINPSEETAAALLGTGEGRIIIVACREQQYSYFSRNAQLTYFTEALVSGLRGKDVRNNHGFIGAFGLYEHIYASVKETVKTTFGKEQEPELTVLKGVGPFAVALYRGASSLGEFDGSEALPQDIPVRQVAPEKSARFFDQRIVQTGGGAYVGRDAHIQGGDFVGRDKTTHGDEVRGDKVAGDKVGGDQISVGSISGSTSVALGRGAQAIVNHGPSGADLGHLFAPLLREVQQTAPPERREEALQTVQALQQEASKGQQANDSRLAGLLEDLVDLVPGAVSTIVGIFATPILTEIAGQVTNYVLEKLHRRSGPS
jgi:hypothetical protein